MIYSPALLRVGGLIPSGVTHAKNVHTHGYYLKLGDALSYIRFKFKFIVIAQHKYSKAKRIWHLTRVQM